MPRAEIDRLETSTVSALLERLEVGAGPAAATSLWNGLPRRQRSQTSLVRAYVQVLMKCGEAKAAESVTREALKSNWTRSCW